MYLKLTMIFKVENVGCRRKRFYREQCQCCGRSLEAPKLEHETYVLFGAFIVLQSSIL
jgi:hypothetical protein